MSLELPPPDYLGLPILTYFEAATLGLMLDPDINDSDVSIPGIGDMVIQRQPLIDRVIAHDVQQLVGHEMDMPICGDHAEMISGGVRDGYEFLIGCFTWVRLQRSGHTDVLEYLSEAAQRRDIPIISPDTLQRIKQVRSGNSLVERAANNGVVETSRDLSRVDATDYFFESMHFDGIYDDHIDRIKTVDEEEGCPLAYGVRHGVNNAVEMYMVAHEEQLFAQAQAG